MRMDRRVAARRGFLTPLQGLRGRVSSIPTARAVGYRLTPRNGAGIPPPSFSRALIQQRRQFMQIAKRMMRLAIPNVMNALVAADPGRVQPGVAGAFDIAV